MFKNLTHKYNEYKKARAEYKKLQSDIEAQQTVLFGLSRQIDRPYPQNRICIAQYQEKLVTQNTDGFTYNHGWTTVRRACPFFKTSESCEIDLCQHYKINKQYFAELQKLREMQSAKIHFWREYRNKVI